MYYIAAHLQSNMDARFPINVENVPIFESLLEKTKDQTLSRDQRKKYKHICTELLQLDRSLYQYHNKINDIYDTSSNAYKFITAFIQSNPIDTVYPYRKPLPKGWESTISIIYSPKIARLCKEYVNSLVSI